MRILMGALAILVASVAHAADMPMKAPYVPAFNWTGCYIGGEAGYGWGRAKSIATEPGGGVAVGDVLTSSDPSGAVVGGTLGCNYQTGNWVWGIENDISWADFRGTNGLNGAPTLTRTTSLHWLDTLRGRVGYAVDRSLLYVTGGVAFAGIKNSAVNGGPPVPDQSGEKTGWTLGGGVEMALADPRWSWKIEYLYVRFNDVKFSDNGCCSLIDAKLHVDESIVRLGLNYKFSGK